MARSINKPMMMIDGDEDLTKKLIADAKKRQDKSSSSQKKPNEQAGTTAAQRDTTEKKAMSVADKMREKGINFDDYKLLMKAAGSKTAADNAILNAPATILRSMIDSEIRKEKKAEEQANAARLALSIQEDLDNGIIPDGAMSMAQANMQYLLKKSGGVGAEIGSSENDIDEYLDNMHISDKLKTSTKTDMLNNNVNVNDLQRGAVVTPISTYDRVQKALKEKGLSLEEWGWIISAHQGNEENARMDLFTKSVSELKTMIGADKVRDSDVKDRWKLPETTVDINSTQSIFNDKIDLSTGWSDASNTSGSSYDDSDVVRPWVYTQEYWDKLNQTNNSDDNNRFDLEVYLMENGIFNKYPTLVEDWTKTFSPYKLEGFRYGPITTKKELEDMTRSLPDLSQPTNEWGTYEIEFNQLLQTKEGVLEDKTKAFNKMYGLENMVRFLDEKEYRSDQNTILADTKFKLDVFFVNGTGNAPAYDFNDIPLSEDPTVNGFKQAYKDSMQNSSLNTLILAYKDRKFWREKLKEYEHLLGLATEEYNSLDEEYESLKDQVANFNEIYRDKWMDELGYEN